MQWWEGPGGRDENFDAAKKMIDFRATFEIDSIELHQLTFRKDDTYTR